MIMKQKYNFLKKWQFVVHPEDEEIAQELTSAANGHAKFAADDEEERKRKKKEKKEKKKKKEKEKEGNNEIKLFTLEYEAASSILLYLGEEAKEGEEEEKEVEEE